MNCGAPGQPIHFEIAAQAMTPPTAWDNRQVWELTLTPTNPGGQASQMSSFDPLQDKTLGDPPFPISAQAAAGLSVSFASLTPQVCTVNGNVVTLLAVGTCTIRASQAGNATYQAASDVDRSFMVFERDNGKVFLPLVVK
jgi:hypothetical protein